MAETRPSKKLAMPSESELVSFEHGAAGHQGISSNASGSLLIKPCVQAEIEFYESAKAHPMFQAHMPTFIGALNQHDDQDAVAPLLDSVANGVVAPPAEAIDTAAMDPTPGLVKRASTWKPSGGKKLDTGLAIVLENVTSGFTRPNVLDVKLGARLWDDDAPLSKRRKLDDVAAETTSGSLGFRVAGMKVYVGQPPATPGSNSEPNVEFKDGYKSFDKNYGRDFDKSNVISAFATYLGIADKNPVKARGKLLASRILRELESIQYVLENEESRMYSASVLFVYEGDDEALEKGLKIEQEAEMQDQEEEEEEEEEEAEEDEEDEDGNEIMPQRVLEARLIDFAHARWAPGQGPDENALEGIRSLIAIFKQLLA